MSLKDIQSWLSGESFRREWWKKQNIMILLVASLIFIYILAGYQAEAQQRQLVNLDQEISDAKIEWLTMNAELTQRTRQSQIVMELNEINCPLIVNTQPLVYIP